MHFQARIEQLHDLAHVWAETMYGDTTHQRHRIGCEVRHNSPIKVNAREQAFGQASTKSMCGTNGSNDATHGNISRWRQLQSGSNSSTHGTSRHQQRRAKPSNRTPTTHDRVCNSTNGLAVPWSGEGSAPSRRHGAKASAKMKQPAALSRRARTMSARTRMSPCKYVICAEQAAGLSMRRAKQRSGATGNYWPVISGSRQGSTKVADEASHLIGEVQ